MSYFLNIVPTLISVFIFFYCNIDEKMNDFKNNFSFPQVEETSAIISSKIQQENVKSDVLVQDAENKEKFVYSHTATQSDILSDWAAEVKNDIG